MVWGKIFRTLNVEFYLFRVGNWKKTLLDTLLMQILLFFFKLWVFVYSRTPPPEFLTIRSLSVYLRQHFRARGKDCLLPQK